MGFLMEILEPLPLFPGYWVSNRGYIKHERSKAPLRPQVNQGGTIYVSLNRESRAANRSLAKIVAETFLPEPEPDFDTPINLNGDRFDCRAENLAWRPFWFARKYHQQFGGGRGDFSNPVYLPEEDRHFESVWDAAITYGLLVRDILLKSYVQEPVWPGNRRFRFVSRIPHSHA